MYFKIEPQKSAPAPPPAPAPGPCKDFINPPKATAHCADMFDANGVSIDCTPCIQGGPGICPSDCVCNGVCDRDNGVVARPRKEDTVLLARSVSQPGGTSWTFEVNEVHGKLKVKKGDNVLVFTDGVLNPGVVPCSCSGTYKVVSSELRKGKGGGLTITVDKGPDAPCNVKSHVKVNASTCMLGLKDTGGLYQQQCMNTGWTKAYIAPELACVDVNECITKRQIDSHGKPEPLCKNGGTCYAMGAGTIDNTFKCDCTDGWTAESNCEKQKDECKDEHGKPMCKHRGVCYQPASFAGSTQDTSMALGEFRCDCSQTVQPSSPTPIWPDTGPSRYYGTTCTAPNNMCATAPCGGPGHQADKDGCEDVDPNTNGGLSFKCNCVGGYDPDTNCMTATSTNYVSQHNPQQPKGQKGAEVAEEAKDGSITTSPSAIRMGQLTIGVRIPNIKLLQYKTTTGSSNFAPLKKANLHFTVYSRNNHSSQPLQVAIRAQRAVALPFGHAKHNISNRTENIPKCLKGATTCAREVLWTIPTDTGTGDKLKTPNLAKLIKMALQSAVFQNGQSAIEFTFTHHSGNGVRTLDGSGIKLTSTSVTSKIAKKKPPTCEVSKIIVPKSKPVHCFTNSSWTVAVTPSKTADGRLVPDGTVCRVECCNGYQPGGTNPGIAGYMGAYQCKADTWIQPSKEFKPGGDFNCNTPLKRCKSNNGGCKKHGKCLELVDAKPNDGAFCPPSSPRCKCDKGWSGHFCQTNVDDCKNKDGSSVCQHKAHCTDLANDFTCKCPKGWKGKKCDEDVDECLTKPCGKHGRACLDSHDDAAIPIGKYRCQCEAGWHGNQDCASPKLMCDNKKLCGGKQHGTCQEASGGNYTCNCHKGYENSPGEQDCSIDIDECADNPCGDEDRGTCKDSHDDPSIAIGAYNCTCKKGWFGDHCKSKTDKCKPNKGQGPCKPKVSTCNADPEGPDGVTCKCNKDSGWGGPHCDIQSPCNDKTDACNKHGVCSDEATQKMVGEPFVEASSHKSGKPLHYNCKCNGAKMPDASQPSSHQLVLLLRG